MQETSRNSMLDFLISSLNTVKKRSFVHRLIYFVVNTTHVDSLSSKIEDNIKEVCYGQWDTPLAGLGIISAHYCIIIMEGTEDALKKHMSLVAETVENTKILIFSPHIRKRYCSNWRTFVVEPPVLLQALTAYNDEHQHVFLVKQCILKLVKFAQRVSLLSETEIETANRELLKFQQELPEPSVINFLATSPLLTSADELLQSHFCVSHSTYHHMVWPMPSQFIPRYLPNSN